MNKNVFGLMKKLKETRFVAQHDSCECKYKLDEYVFNSKEKCYNDKCLCECKK